MPCVDVCWFFVGVPLSDRMPCCSQLDVIRDILNTHERAMKEVEAQVGDLIREAGQLKSHLDIGRG
jgi:hypothetical protein